MAPPEPPAPRPAPSSVLGAYLGELLAGKRVALLGDGSTPLADQLAAAAGRRVHVFDPDARRTAEAIARSRGAEGRVRYALLESDAEISAHAFDVVLVPDLGELVASGAVDAAGAIALADSMLGPRGFAAIAAPAGDESLGYYRLYDLCAARFRDVRMLGAAPFVGFTVAAFGGDDEPAVSIDSSLSERPEEPLSFVAIASRQSLAIEPYLLVQLPASEGLAALGQVEAPAPPSAPAEDWRERERQARELAEARAKSLTAVSARLSELESALERQRNERRRERDELQAERERERDENQRELDAMLERIADLEAQLEARADTEKAAPKEPKPEDASPRQIQGLEFQIAELRRLLGETRSECDALRPEAARAKALDAELERAKKQIESASVAASKTRDEESAADAAADLAALEVQLQERGRRVAELEGALREGERIGRELVRDLDDARARGGNGAGAAEVDSLQQKLAELGDRCARYQADLESAGWTIDALERRIGEALVDDVGSDVAKLEAALRAAHDEIARLRQSGQ